MWFELCIAAHSWVSRLKSSGLSTHHRGPPRRPCCGVADADLDLDWLGEGEMKAGGDGIIWDGLPTAGGLGTGAAGTSSARSLFELIIGSINRLTVKSPQIIGSFSFVRFHFSFGDFRLFSLSFHWPTLPIAFSVPRLLWFPWIPVQCWLAVEETVVEKGLCE